MLSFKKLGLLQPLPYLGSCSNITIKSIQPIIIQSFIFLNFSLLIGKNAVFKILFDFLLTPVRKSSIMQKYIDLVKIKFLKQSYQSPSIIEIYFKFYPQRLNIQSKILSQLKFYLNPSASSSSNYYIFYPQISPPIQMHINCTLCSSKISPDINHTLLQIRMHRISIGDSIDDSNTSEMLTLPFDSDGPIHFTIIISHSSKVKPIASFGQQYNINNILEILVS